MKGRITMVLDSESRLEVLITIIDKDLGDDLIELYEEYQIPVALMAYGYGSAKPRIFELLGYGGPKKIISYSIHSKRTSDLIMKSLYYDIDICRPGTGIAFSIKLSSVSRVLSDVCKNADDKIKIESEDMSEMIKEPYHLIISIVNSGYFEEVMDAAKDAGARGGTLIHAKSIGSKEAIKYLGITVQPEKDLAMILARQEDRHAIMESIAAKAGLKTEAMGICFSLPVDTVLGIESILENFDEI
jgi:nitrogen regulatory protein PII